MDVGWPPSGDDSQVLEELRLLIEQGGAAHFLDAPIVRADAQDFPEPWAPTRACLERLLLRMFWLSYVDLDVTVEDARSGAFDSHQLLRRSVIDWVKTKDGTAAFRMAELGNDNIAGHLAHEVGRAFAAWVDTPGLYREAEGTDPSLRRGSVAAVYLGLGVLACNGAYYHRVVSETRGTSVATEGELVVNGGLTTPQLLLLLAVQAVLRGKSEVAHEHLGMEKLRQDFRAAVAKLRPHRAAIAAHLGLDLEAARQPLEREAAAPTVSDEERPEEDRTQRHAGMLAAREVQRRTYLGVAIGFASGLLGAIVGVWLYARGILDPTSPRRPLIAAGLFVLPFGYAFLQGYRSKVQVCSACRSALAPNWQTCHACGATLTSIEELTRARREQAEREEDALAAEIEEAEREEAEEEAAKEAASAAQRASSGSGSGAAPSGRGRRGDASEE